MNLFLKNIFYKNLIYKAYFPYTKETKEPKFGYIFKSQKEDSWYLIENITGKTYKIDINWVCMAILNNRGEYLLDINGNILFTKDKVRVPVIRENSSRTKKIKEYLPAFVENHLGHLYYLPEHLEELRKKKKREQYSGSIYRDFDIFSIKEFEIIGSLFEDFNSLNNF